MSFNGCKEAVMDVVDKASKEFASKYIMSPVKSGKLNDMCRYIDTMIADFDVEFFDVSVDDVTKQFTIAIVCDEMILERGRSHDFFKLIQLLDSFSFKKKGRASICVTMNIDSMWEVASGF